MQNGRSGKARPATVGCHFAEANDCSIRITLRDGDQIREAFVWFWRFNNATVNSKLGVAGDLK
jgi:hypothetical protein